jgi:thiol:disulfide interchange protein DsbD
MTAALPLSSIEEGPATSSTASSAAATAGIESRDTQGLGIEMISEVSSIEAGESFRVGLKIKHDPSFHTYWKNPGVVGVPTGLTWKLPHGFTASSIQWPYPEISKMATYPCYGYERDIVLITTITAAEAIDTPSVTLSAEGSWMCCGALCYPGFKTFTLRLAVGEHVIDRVHAEDFARASVSLPSTSHAFSAKLLSAPDAGEIQVEISSTKSFTPLHVFNADRQTTPDLKCSLSEKRPNRWIYKAERSEHGPDASASFAFVLQTTTGFFELNTK